MPKFTKIYLKGPKTSSILNFVLLNDINIQIYSQDSIHYKSLWTKLGADPLRCGPYRAIVS